MECYVVLCYVMLCTAMQCYVMSCHVMKYVRIYVYMLYMYNRSTTNHVLYAAGVNRGWRNGTGGGGRGSGIV